METTFSTSTIAGTTLTLCGSMKYHSEMQSIAGILELDCRVNVIQPIYGLEQRMHRAELQRLTALHEAKIRMSDGIYVVDIDGYIGGGTRHEIEYAETIGKGVYYHSQFPDIQAALTQRVPLP